MGNWYDRFKEIREKYKLSQAKIGRMIGKDGTQVSRYERGAVKGFPNSLYKLLKDIFTEDEINYIEHGDSKKDVSMVQSAKNTVGFIKKTKGDAVDESDEIVNIVKILKTFDTKQQRAVLRFVWEMEEGL